MSYNEVEEPSLKPPLYQTLLRKFKSLPHLVVITTLAVIVGILAGLGAVFTEWLVEVVHHAFFEEKLWGLLNVFGEYYLIVIPAIGALIFTPLFSTLPVKRKDTAYLKF
ncbi:membrane protein [Beggiatoa sp. PS]|nr:membrane protein [Beggiatoa sp. PS]